MATNPLMDFYFSRLDRAADEKTRARTQTLQEQQLAENVNQFLQTMTAEQAKFGEAKSQFNQTFAQGQLENQQRESARKDAQNILLTEAIGQERLRPAIGPERNARAVGKDMFVPVNQRELAITDARLKTEQNKAARQEQMQFYMQQGLTPMRAALLVASPAAGAQTFSGLDSMLGMAYLDPKTPPSVLRHLSDLWKQKALAQQSPTQEAYTKALTTQALTHSNVYAQTAKDKQAAEQGRLLLLDAYNGAGSQGLSVEKPGAYINFISSFIKNSPATAGAKQAAMSALLGESSLRSSPFNFMQEALGGTLGTPAPRPATPIPGSTLINKDRIPPPVNETPEQRQAREQINQLLQFNAPR